MVSNNLPEINDLVQVKHKGWKSPKTLKLLGKTHHLQNDLHQVYLYFQ
jgi:hypothetical protein